MIQDNGASQDSLLISDVSADDDTRRRRQKILNLLRGRYHWAIAAAVILAIAAGVLTYTLQPDTYTSHARLEMRPQLPSIDGGQDRPPYMWDEFIATKMSLLTTPTTVNNAMASEGWKRAAQAAGLSDFSNSDFRDALHISRVPKSNLIDVFFEHEQPMVAQAGVDAAINAFLQAYEEQEARGDLRRLEALLQQQQKLDFELRRLGDQKRALTGGSDLGSAALSPQYQYALEEQIALKREIDQIERQLANITEGKSYTDAPVAELIAVDRTLASLNAQRSAVQQQVEQLSLQGIGENNHSMKSLRAQVTIKEREIEDRIARLRSGEALPDGAMAAATNGPALDMNGMKARHAELQRAYAEAEARTTSLLQQLNRVSDVEAQIAKNEQELARNKDIIERMDLQKLISGRVDVLASGLLPSTPSNGSKRLKMSALAGFAGAALGVGGVMLIGLLDPRMRHIDDAQVDLPKARMLGILPTLPVDLQDAEQAVLVAHSVHHIRTLMQIGRDSSNGNVFSVTSPASGSGKTSLTMALGLSFAASGCKTLLIDADIVGGGLTRRMGFVVHPRLGQVLRQMGLVTDPQIQDALRVAQSTGARIGEALVSLGYVNQADVDEALQRQTEQSIGLLDACGEHRFEECVAPTGIRNLYILPIGTALPQHAGALSPATMRKIIQQARNQFDTVLIDTGPLLGSLEASMAAAEADAALLIVSRGDQKPLVSKCVEHLQSIGGRLAGVVFNHALATDIARSTYGSVTMSQSRHPNNSARMESLDADTSARFGPLATAVASYAASGDTERGRRNGSLAKENGNGNAKSNGNGKHHSNGNGHG